MAQVLVKLNLQLQFQVQVLKDIERSRQAGHTKVWAQRDKIAKDLEKKIEEGKKAIKKLERI